MAEAAKKQAKWTERQFWAVVAEIGALALTVFFTRWAAVAASRAAKAATAAVNAQRCSEYCGEIVVAGFHVNEETRDSIPILSVNAIGPQNSASY